MSTQIATRNPSEITYQTDAGIEITLSPQIVRQYLVNGQGNISDQEVMMFLQLCRSQRLNPFVRDCYLIKYSDKNPASIVTGKETFTKRAMRSPDFQGMEAGIVVLKQDGTLEYRPGTIKLPNEMLVGGWAKVYKAGYQVPVEGTASFEEFVQKKWNYETKQWETNAQWSRMPGVMIRKVALVQTLREAFPEDFSGLYSQEEMPVDGDALPMHRVEVVGVYEEPATIIEQPQPPKEQPMSGQAKAGSYSRSKPQQQDTEEYERPPFPDEEPPFPVNANTGEIIDQSNPDGCNECGASITEKVRQFSEKKYGRPLCFRCQASAQ